MNTKCPYCFKECRNFGALIWKCPNCGLIVINQSATRSLPHELLKDIAETCGVQVISNKQLLQGILADIAPFSLEKTKKIILLAVNDNVHKKLSNSDIKNKFAAQNFLDREIAGYMVDAFAYAHGVTQSIPNAEKSKIERWFSDKTDYSAFEETNKPQPQPHLQRLPTDYILQPHLQPIPEYKPQPQPQYKPQPQPEYKPPPKPVYTPSTSSKEDGFLNWINENIWIGAMGIPILFLVFNLGSIWYWIYGIITLTISVVCFIYFLEDDIPRWLNFIIALFMTFLAIGIPLLIPSKPKKENIEIVETLAIAGEWRGNLTEGNRNIPLELEIIGNSKDSIAARMIIHATTKVEYEYTVRLEGNNLYFENKAKSGNYSGDFEGVVSEDNTSISGVYKSRNAELKFELSKSK